MKIQDRLQIIGQILTNRYEPPKSEGVKEAYQSYREKSDIISFFDTANGSRLTDQQTASAKLLLANEEWVYRNNDVIALEVSSIDFELYRARVVGDELRLDRIGKHPILDLLDRFNDATSRSDGIYNTQSHKKMVGDAFWLLDDKGINVENIYLLNPTEITLDLGDFSKEDTKAMIKGYQFKTEIKKKNGKSEEVERYYQPEEIIHFKKPNPNNPYRGYGAVEAAAKTIDLDSLVNDTQRDFFRRGAITNFVITTEQKLSQDQRKALRAELKSNYTGKNNAFRAMLLTNGMKPENITMSNKDMEFLAQLKWYRDKIMVIFGNNPASLGIIEDVNRANSESSIRNWKSTTIRSEMASLVNTLNEFLLPRWGDNLVLGFADPVPEDEEKTAKQAIELKRGGVITRNEAREMIGYDSTEGGDDFAEDRITVITNPDDKKQLPASLRDIDIKAFYRRANIHSKVMTGVIQKQSLALAKAIAKKKKKAKKDNKPIVKTDEAPKQFTRQQIEKYYYAQMAIVDVMEKQLENRALQLSTQIVEEGLSNIDNEDARSRKTLVDHKMLQAKAQATFEPLLRQIGTQAGSHAYDLIGIDDPYIPKDYTKGFVDDIRDNILKFAGSMIDSDVDIMVGMIVEGLKNELSIPQIKRNIRDKFFGKGREANIQAERIARTETIKASNMGIQDAFEQSGVVTGKEWLAELDSRTSDICEWLNGKVVELDSDWFGKGDSVTFLNLRGEEVTFTANYDDIRYPPAHPNCRSTLIPVIVGQRAFNYNRGVIAELKLDIDKRTKEYKELEKKYKEEKIADAEYIEKLEELAGVEDDK